MVKVKLRKPNVQDLGDHRLRVKSRRGCLLLSLNDLMSSLRPVACNASGRQIQSQALVASQHTPRLLQQGVAGEAPQIIPAAVNPGFKNGAAPLQPGSEPSKWRPALGSQRPLEVNVATVLDHGPQEGSRQPNHLACDLPVLGELLKSAGSLLLQILHRRIRSAGY